MTNRLFKYMENNDDDNGDAAADDLRFTEMI